MVLIEINKLKYNIGFYFSGIIAIIEIILICFLLVKGVNTILFHKIYYIDIDNETTSNSQLNESTPLQNNINSPYQNSIMMKTTNILYFFCILVTSKIELAQIFLFPKQFEILSISLSFYLLSLLTDFTMNAILFSDDVISQKYHNQGKISFTTTMSYHN